MIALNRTVRFARGFSWRREAFGGILYHYEGHAPDPRVTFVQSPFLLDLLQLLDENPETSPGELLQQVARHFNMTPAVEEEVKGFLLNLIERGALEPC